MNLNLRWKKGRRPGPSQARSPAQDRQDAFRRSDMGPRWRTSCLEVLEDRRLLTVVNYSELSRNLGSELSVLQQGIQAGVDAFRSGTFGTLPMSDGLPAALEEQFGAFRPTLTHALDNLGSVDDTDFGALRSAIVTALGPAGMHILVDRSTSSTTTGVGSDDVLITQTGTGQFELEARLFLPVAQTGASTQFSLGLPGLPFDLKSTGSLVTSVGVAYELAFRFNTDGVVFSLDSDKTLSGFVPPVSGYSTSNLDHPLAFFVNVGPSSDFSTSARLGFIQGGIAPVPGAQNGLTVMMALDNISSGSPTVEVDGAAAINMRLTGSFTGGNLDFPGIDTDFHVNWAFSSSNPDLNPPEVSFDNVYLNLGHFISDLLTPVLQNIQDATDPLKPVLKVLNTPLPGLSDLSEAVGKGDVTLLTLAGLVAPFTGFGPLYDLSQKVLTVLDTVQDIQISDTIRLPLGGFNLDNYDLRSSQPAGSIDDLDLPNLTSLDIDPANIQALGQTFAQTVSSLPVPAEVKGVLNDITAGLNNGFSIQFPLLDNPASAIFNMILGKDSDLFSLTADAHIKAQGELAPTGLYVFNQEIVFGGEVDVDLHFKFAYDTFGLRELIDHLVHGQTSDIASDITDGFYISTDSYFNLAGDIYAGIGESIGPVEVLLDGHVSTGDNGNDPIAVSVANPTDDGKQRFSEFGAMPFATQGELDAGLGLEVRLGKEIFGKFIGVKKRFDVAHEVVVTFVPPPPPTLASQPDASGNVVLYLGAHAGQRQGEDLDQVDGDESYTIRHLATTPAGETIKVNAFGKSQIIEGVHSISAVDGLGSLEINVLPGVTSNVDFRGGQGPARLTYRGTGNAVLYAGNEASDLEGGWGDSELHGGPGDDTITLGHRANTVTGGAGHNTIVVQSPVSANGSIDAGTSGGNSLVILGDNTTREIDGTVVGSLLDVAIAAAGGAPPSHLSIADIGDILVNAQNRSTNMAFDDLTPAGVTQLLIDAKTTLATGRDFSLDSSTGLAAANVDVNPITFDYDNPGDAEPVHEVGISIANHTTGMNVQVFGLAGDDRLTLLQHGGSLNIAALALTSGELLVDESRRLPGAAQSIRVTTPVQNDGINLNASAHSGNFHIGIDNYPSFTIVGSTPNDSLTLQVNAPGQVTGTNRLAIDASSLQGSLTVNALGGITAQNDVTLSAAHQSLATFINGNATTTLLHFATGKLSDIRHTASASNVTLQVDNSAATAGSLLHLDEGHFGTWVVPSTTLAPQLNISQLRGPMLVLAGAGDRFQLDATPASIDSLQIDNASDTLDPVYTANWSVPLTLNGDLALYLGQKLRDDDTVERTKHLTNVQTSFVLNFHGSNQTHIVVDSALDAPGDAYSLEGKGELDLQHVGGGLSIVMLNQRADDDLLMYLSGASVIGNFKEVPDMTFRFDGTERLQGANPNASNIYNLTSRAGSVAIDAIGDNHTRASMYHTVFVRGSLPQDQLTIQLPTGASLSSSIPMSTESSAAPSTVDGSELRGQLFLNVLEPDWLGVQDAYKEEIQKALDEHRPVDPNLFLDVTHAEIAINKVRQDLNVHVAGTSFYDSMLFVEFSRFLPPDLTELVEFLTTARTNSQHIVGQAENRHWRMAYNSAAVTVGNGDLSLIQGDVFVDRASVTINDRYGSRPNILNVDSIGVSGWSTVSGSTPALHIGSMFGKFEFDVSPVDRFNIDDTPQRYYEANLATAETAWATLNRLEINFDGTLHTYRVSSIDDFLYFKDDRTIIRNFSTTGAPADIYVTGKDITEMDISGNFSLYAGRRLLPDGSVQNVGDVTKIVADPIGTYRHLTRAQPIDFTYTGPGMGTAVWDASHMQLTSSVVNALGGIYFYGLMESPLNPGRATFDFVTGNYLEIQKTTNNFNIDSQFYQRGSLVYGGNTDMTFYAPSLRPNEFFNPVLDNPVASTFHYYSNPNNDPLVLEEPLIYATVGDVDIHGTRGVTHVVVAPPFFGGSRIDDYFSSNFSPSQSPMPYLTASPYLNQTVRGDLYVADAALQLIPFNQQIHPDPPPVIPDVHLTGSTLTGVTGGTIYLSHLADWTAHFPVGGSTTDLPETAPTSDHATAGLTLDLPGLGHVNTVIEDTPAGAFTAVNTRATTPQDTTVLGTTGPLVLGQYLNGPSLKIGSGTLENMHGAIYLQGQFHGGVTTIDGHLDSARTVSVTPISSSAQETAAPHPAKIVGLAPVTIYLDQRNDLLQLIGSPGSTFNFSYAGTTNTNWQLFTGAHTTVNINPWQTDTSNSGLTPAMDVYGAETINALVPNAILGAQNSLRPLRIFADPNRPHDPVALNFDFSTSTTSTTSYDTLFLERFDATQGTLRATGTPAAGVNLNDRQVLFPTALTHLSIKSGGTPSRIATFNVVDTPAVDVSLDPGRATVNVTATTGALSITQGTTAASQVIVTPSGNLQTINGAITIVANDSSRPRLPVRFNDTNDMTQRTAQLAVAADLTTITGIAPATLGWRGSLVDVTLTGGAGANTLGGADTANNWQLAGSNAGTLNGNVTFSRFANLRGGSSTDDFTFNFGGSVTGNVDAAASVDTAHYPAGRIGSEVVDLAHNKLPGIGGAAINFENVDIEAPIALVNPGNQSSRLGKPITPVTIQATGGNGARTFSAFNLPLGLSIDSQTGVISGTINPSVFPNSNYGVSLRVQDLTGSSTVAIVWSVLSGFELANPGTLAGQLFTSVSQQITLLNNFDTTATFAAQGLPAGLSMDPATGLVSGTYLPSNASPQSNFVIVSATDGVHFSNVSFPWIVQQPEDNLSLLAGPNGGLIAITSPAGTKVTAGSIVPVNYNVPSAAQAFPWDGLSLSVSQVVPGSSVELIIKAPRADNLQSVYLQDTAGHWTNYLGAAGPNSARLEGDKLIVDLDDGGAVDQTFSADGAISLFLASANPILAGKIIGLPALASVGQSISLSRELVGPGAGTATSSWQLLRDDQVVANSNGPTFSFAPAQTGTYHVLLTVSDPVSGFTKTTTADLQVPPTLADLNAGTPAGTPYLAGVLSPGANSIGQITPIAFSNLPGAPTFTYFVTGDDESGGSQFWQNDGLRSTIVMRGDSPGEPVSQIGTLVNVDGAWLAGVAYDHIWAMTPAGGRLAVSADQGLQDIRNPVATGSALYFSAYEPAVGYQVFRLQATGTGSYTLDQMTSLADSNGQSFYGPDRLVVLDEGRLSFSVFTNPPDGSGLPPNDAVYVLDGRGATGVLRRVVMPATVDFAQVDQIGVARDGTTEYVIVTRRDASNTVALYAADAAGLDTGDITATAVNSVNDYYAPEGVAVGDRFAFTTYDISTGQQSLFVTNGTTGGTAQVGAATLNGQSIFHLTAAGDQLYFSGYDPTSGVSTLWRLDANSTEPVPVLTASDISDFVSIGGGLLIVAAPLGSSDHALYRIATPGDSAQLVPVNPNNAPSDLRQLTALGNTAYFAASSSHLPLSDGSPSMQLWSLGPAPPAVPSTLNSLDLLVAGDIVTGNAPDLTAAALNVAGVVAANFAGAVEVELRDSHGSLVYSTTGNFAGGTYHLQLPILAAAGPSTENFTLTVNSGGQSVQRTIAVHPASQFAPATETLVKGINSPFTLSLQADDDRGAFVPSYSGQVRLSYVDNLGNHELGTATSSHGLVSFSNLAFSSYGTHELVASSLDGQITSTLRVTVPLATQFVVSPSSSTSVVIDDPFDFQILAADQSGHAMASYTGLVKVVIARADTTLSTASYWLDATKQGHLVLSNLALHELGTYTVTVSDGIVSSVLSIDVEEEPVLVGDLTHDGIVNASDINILYNLVHTHDPTGDLNHDGQVNQGDVDFLIRDVLHTQYGDVNLDGFVDTADLAIIRRNTNASLSGPSWAQGDVTGDAFVDVTDLGLLRKYTGFSRSAGSQAQVAPGIAAARPVNSVLTAPTVIATSSTNSSLAHTGEARVTTATTESTVVAITPKLVVNASESSQSASSAAPIASSTVNTAVQSSSSNADRTLVPAAPPLHQNPSIFVAPANPVSPAQTTRAVPPVYSASAVTTSALIDGPQAVANLSFQPLTIVSAALRSASESLTFSATPVQLAANQSTARLTATSSASQALRVASATIWSQWESSTSEPLLNGELEESIGALSLWHVRSRRAR
jgi:hypothetical protein